MLIDHTGMAILSQLPEAQIPLFSFLGNPVSLYRLSRDIGRVAFPIFIAFCWQKDFCTQKKIVSAMERNLLLFAILSELPWNYIHTNTFFYEKQNCFLRIHWVSWFLRNRIFSGKTDTSAFLYFGAFGNFLFFQADYGWKGFIFLLIMYTLHKERTAQAIIGMLAFLRMESLLRFLSINMYNGKRGFIKGKGAKYFFYAFYPLHLSLLIFIRQYLS